MLVALLPSVALAFNVSGEALPPARLPLEVHWSGTLRGFSEAELRATVEGAATAWVGSASCEVEITLVRDPEAHRWYEAGGVAVLLGDPQDMLADGQLVVRTSVPSGGPSFERMGARFTDVGAVEIVLNDGVSWLPDADIAAGGCVDGLSAQGALTHELGHVLGLADSCPWGDACADDDAAVATMYGSLPTCDTAQSTLGADDIEGLASIYGAAPALAFGCERAAAESSTVRCVVTEPSDAAGLDPVWDFGDGSTGVGADVTHSYATPARYEVQVCMDVPGCASRRCVTGSVDATAGGDTTVDTGPADTAAPSDTGTAESGAGCGCATDAGRGVSALLVGVAAAVVGRRRRYTP